MNSTYSRARATALAMLLIALLDSSLLAQRPSGDSSPPAPSPIESLRLSGASSPQLRDSLAIAGYIDAEYVAQHPRACTESQYSSMRIRRLNLPLPPNPDGWVQIEVTERRLASGRTDLPMISVRRGAGDGPQLEGAVLFGAFLRVERVESRNDRSSAIEMFPFDDSLTAQLHGLAEQVLALTCNRR